MLARLKTPRQKPRNEPQGAANRRAHQNIRGVMKAQEDAGNGNSGRGAGEHGRPVGVEDGQGAGDGERRDRMARGEREAIGRPHWNIVSYIMKPAPDVGMFRTRPPDPML